MRRRRVLAAAGAGATGLLAGCSRFGDGGTETETETPQGQWELRGTVVNEDDEPRSWRVEARTGRGSVAAWGAVPAGGSWELGLAGQVRDEQVTVYVESDGGATTSTWRPTECRELSLLVTISGGDPQQQLECSEGS